MMSKKIFFSFDYDDSWKAQQVRNMGVVTNENIMEPNDWEKLKRTGKQAIQNWIDNQLQKSDMVVVLIGTQTHNSDWVKYEINKAMDMGRKVVGIHINNLEDRNGRTSSRGISPFSLIHRSSYSYSSPEEYEPSSYNTYNDIKNKLASL